MGWVLIGLAVLLLFLLPPLMSRPVSFRDYLSDLWDFTKFFGTFLLAVAVIVWLLISGLFSLGLVH